MVELRKGLHPWPIQAPDSDYGLSHVSHLSGAGVDCLQTIPIPDKNVILSLCWVSTVESQDNYVLSLVSTVSSTSFVVAEKGF